MSRGTSLHTKSIEEFIQLSNILVRNHETEKEDNDKEGFMKLTINLSKMRLTLLFLYARNI